MKDIFKVFKAEIYRLSRSKFTLILCAVFIVFIMAAGILVVNTYEKITDTEYSPVQSVTQEEREVTLKQYENSLKNEEELLAQAKLSGATKTRIAEIEEAIAELSFFLDSGTVQGDYIREFDLITMAGSKGTAFLIISVQYISYGAMLIPLFLAASLFAAPYKSGAVKHVASAPLSRRSVMLGKFLALFICVTAVLAVFAALCLSYAGIAGLSSDKTVLTQGSFCRAYSVMSVFFIKLAGVYVVMLLFSFLAAFFGALTKSSLGAVALPILLYLLLFGLKLILYDMNYSIINGISYFNGNPDFVNFLPGLGIMEYDKAYSGRYLLIIGYNILLAVYAVIASCFIFRKRDL